MRKPNIFKNVSDSSAKAYQEITAEGIALTQERKVLSFLKSTKARFNSRQLGKHLQIERTAITRVLVGLQRDHLIEMTGHEKCPYTNRTTQFYTAIV